MKIAQYKNVEHGYICIREPFPYGDGEWPGGEVFRVSEWATVDFVPIDREVLVAREVAALDKAAADIQAKAYDAIQIIERRKAELLALPAPEAA